MASLQLFPRAGSARAVVAGCAQLVSTYAQRDALDHVDRALAPIKVHLAVFPAPFSTGVMRHLLAVTSQASTW
jgi:hypothetical protein